MERVTKSRSTKYQVVLLELMSSLGHATNAQLLMHMQVGFPELSATTVHRLTARMAERGLIATAPSAADGAVRYDANTTPHDHFLCEGCGGLQDIDVLDKLLPILQCETRGCSLSGRVTISGNCKQCIKEVRNE